MPVRSKPHSSYEQSASNGPTNKRQKTKFGRRDLRQVQYKGPKSEHDETINNEDAAEEAEGNSDSDNEDEDDDDDDDLTNRKSYDVLVTLLKSEHRKKKVPKGIASKKTTEVEIANEDDEEDDEEDVENKENENNSENEDSVGIKNGSADDDEDDDDGNKQDPFMSHSTIPDEKFVNASVINLETATKKWTLSRQPNKALKGSIITYSSPISLESSVSDNNHEGSLSKYKVKSKLKTCFEKNYTKLTPLQKQLVDPLFQYKDMLYPIQTMSTEDEYRDLYLLHILNHITKTRDLVLKNNAKKAVTPDIDPDSLIRDHGFTRPKCLILLPSRNACYELVNKLAKLSGCQQEENKKKFKAQFFEDSQPPENKPDDFRHTFKGNVNDMFVMGVKFTRTALKLYSSFYKSDLIIASPLGLLLIANSDDKKKRDFNFLSSIEITIIDQINFIQMQKWENLWQLMPFLNKTPTNFESDLDISRVKMFIIDKQARFLRQTLIFGEFLTPEINSLFNKHCNNVFGKVKLLQDKINDSDSILSNIYGINKVRHLFSRFDANIPTTDPERRFNLFTSTILSLIKRQVNTGGVLLFIPSFADYLKVKNYLKQSTSLSFEAIDEYTSVSDMTRGRSYFSTGKTPLLLYTERLHFYRRFVIKGVKSVIIYQLPTHPNFYQEIVEFASMNKQIDDSEETSATSLCKINCYYSKWDALRLERIVGSRRAAVLTQGPQDVYEFK